MATCRVLEATLAVSVVVCAAEAKPQAHRSQTTDARELRIEAETAPIIDQITFSGLRRVAPAALQMRMSSREGEALDNSRIASDVKALGRLGWFASVRAEVESAGPPSDVSEGPPRHTRMRFCVEENPFLTNVEYHGSRLLSRAPIEKLLAQQKIDVKPGEPENPATLRRAERAITSALAELGHPEARVEIRRAESSNATVGVRFEIDDGPHVPVGRVQFEGETGGVPARKLRTQMQNLRPGAWFAGLRGKNAYTREGFEQDREQLLSYYANHGFPEARVGAASVSKYEKAARWWVPWLGLKPSPRLEVAVPLASGPLYRVETVHVSKELREAATGRSKLPEAAEGLRTGQPYSAQGVDAIQRAWQARVHPRAWQDVATTFRGVVAVRAFDPLMHTARITLDLSDSPPYVVRRLEFQGLKRFPDRYLRSRIPLKEGTPFDQRALEAGLARLARTAYFKPIRKEDVRVVMDALARTADVTIRVEELGQQRASLVGGRGQFGSTVGIVYTVFNLFHAEELLSSHIEGGPESLQLALGFAKEGVLGSRGSLALSVFNSFLRPRLAGSTTGPFFKQETEGVDATWSHALTNKDSISVGYDLSRSNTQYSPTVLTGVAGFTVTPAPAETSSHAAGLGWTHDSGTERIVLADSVSGGWLGGSENVVRWRAECGRIWRDPIFDRQNAWAVRTAFSGVGSYSGDMPFYARLFTGDEFVRGLRAGELGPESVVSSVSSTGATKYSAAPAGADLVGAVNAEYRVRMASGTEASGFFDLGSGMLLPNWLGQARPSLIDSTDTILHGSAGIQLQWTVPGVGVPVRVYYALNALRLNRWVTMPDGSLFHVRNRAAGFGWGLGPLF
jgi:outer membrane protein assembly complex protein YaeT